MKYFPILFFISVFHFMALQEALACESSHTPLVYEAVLATSPTDKIHSNTRAVLLDSTSHPISDSIHSRVNSDIHLKQTNNTSVDSSIVDSSYTRITKKNMAIADSLVTKTTYYFYYNYFNSKIDSTFHPVFDVTSKHRLDKVLQFHGDYYAYRHGVGQPHRQLHFGLPLSPHFQFQTNPFPAYVFTPENIKFYQTTHPYTELEFSNSFSSDYQVNVTHSQNILPNWNIGLDYNLVNSKGIYTNSAVMNHQISATTNYFSKDTRYALFGGLIWNNFKVGESGGIMGDSLFTQNIQTTRPGIPVYKNISYTKYKDLEGFINQSFRFEKLDSLSKYGQSLNWGKLTHEIYYQKEIRVFFDSASLTPYEHIYFDSLKTYDSLRTIVLRNTLLWSNDIYQDALYHNPVKLYLGARYDLIRNQSQEEKNSFIQRTLIGKAKITPFHRLTLIPFAEYVVSGDYSKGDYCFKTMADINFSNSPIPINPWFEVSLSAKKPDFIFAKYASNHYVWDNIVTQTKLFKTNASFKHRNFDIGATYYSIDNLYYFNEAAIPSCDSSQINLLQIHANTEFHFGKLFHWKGVNVIQASSKKEVLTIPLYFAKHSFYFDFWVFKKTLRLQPGVDLYYNSEYYPDAYSPDLASFYIQRDQKLGGEIWADVFIAAQVSRATIFLKVSHVNSIFKKNPNYFMIPHYPTNDLLVKWGFSWKFFD